MGIFAGKVRRTILAAILLAGLQSTSRAQTWVRLGPEGGEAISLATTSIGEILLGTADGHIFASMDGGTNWRVRGHIGSRWDAVVQALVADPAGPGKIYVQTRSDGLQKGVLGTQVPEDSQIGTVNSSNLAKP